MKHMIIYWTKTGHSKKLAMALSEALSIPAIDLKTKLTLDEPVDTLFLVSGIYGGKNDPALITELAKLDPGKIGRVVLVTSCTSGSAPSEQARKTLTELGIPVVPKEFLCKGGFLIFAWKHPDRNDLNHAVEFAKGFL